MKLINVSKLHLQHPETGKLQLCGHYAAHQNCFVFFILINIPVSESKIYGTTSSAAGFCFTRTPSEQVADLCCPGVVVYSNSNRNKGKTLVVFFKSLY